MPNSLVQTRIDATIKEQAAAVLSQMGLTVSDAVRILLTRIANEGAIPIELTTDPVAYDKWFKAKVQEALDDTREPISQKEVKQHFQQRRKLTQSKANS